MPFEKNSFLGKQIEVIRNNHISNNEERVIFLNDINKKLNEILYEFKQTSDENYTKDRVIISLFCKIIQCYNSIIIVSNYGLESDAKTLLRSMMETSFHLCAIIYDDEYYDTYVKTGEYQTNYLLRTINKHKEIFTDEAKNAVDDDALKYYKDSLKGFRPPGWEKLAKKANMLELYLYTYNLLSLQAHGNIKAVSKNHMIFKEENEVIIDMTPKYDDIVLISSTSIFISLSVVDALSTYFNQDYNSFVREANTKLHNMYSSFTSPNTTVSDIPK